MDHKGHYDRLSGSKCSNDIVVTQFKSSGCLMFMLAQRSLSSVNWTSSSEQQSNQVLLNFSWLLMVKTEK